MRVSLDETFDVGEDTGTAVVDDYSAKMPFAFTGTLKKFVVVLEPQKLSAEEQKRLLEKEAEAAMALQQPTTVWKSYREWSNSATPDKRNSAKH